MVKKNNWRRLCKCEDSYCQCRNKFRFFPGTGVVLKDIRNGLCGNEYEESCKDCCSCSGIFFLPISITIDIISCSIRLPIHLIRKKNNI